MSYSVVSDIKSEFKSVSFLDGQKIGVSSEEVTEFIVQADARIDANIGQRYALPVTSSRPLSLLKKISIDFVAFRVAKILNLRKSIPIPDETVVQELNEGACYRESKEMLEEFKSGDLILPDTDLVSSSSGISSGNSNNNINSIWKRDTKQW